jgi:hypothetical protein
MLWTQRRSTWTEISTISAVTWSRTSYTNPASMKPRKQSFTAFSNPSSALRTTTTILKTSSPLRCALTGTWLFWLQMNSTTLIVTLSKSLNLQMRTHLSSSTFTWKGSHSCTIRSGKWLVEWCKLCVEVWALTLSQILIKTTEWKWHSLLETDFS